MNTTKPANSSTMASSPLTGWHSIRKSLSPARCIPRIVAMGMAAALLFSHSASAANTTYFWDASGVNTDQGGTGTWDATSLFWDTAATGGTMQAWPNASGATSTADFSGTAGTVTIASGTTINVNSIVFGTTGYILNGGSGTSILNLNGTTPTITTGTGNTETINATINGTAGFTKTADNGTLILGGSNTYTGNTILQGGTLTLSHAGAINAGIISLASGTSTLTETVANGISGSAGLSLAGAGATFFTTVILSASNNFTGAITLGNNANNILTLTDPNAIASAASLSTTAGTINLFSNSSVTFNTPSISTAGGSSITLNVDDLDGITTNQTITISGTLTPRSNGSVNFTGGHGYTLALTAVALDNTANQTSTLYANSGHLTVGTITNVVATGTAVIVLGGLNTTNSVTGVISNGSGTMALTLSSTGAAWTLSGTNTYTGKTTLTSGTLVAANTQALGASTAPLILGGATLDLATDTSITAYNVTGTASSTILSDKATAGSAGITQTLGTLSMGAFTLNIAAGANVSGGSPVVAFGATTLNATTGNGTTVFNPTTASVTLASVTSLATTGNTNTLQLDGTATGNQITGTIDNGVSSGTTALVKASTSTWTLSGANTYSGGTIIKNGNLVIANSTGSATGTGTVTLTGSSAGAHATLSGSGIISGLVTTTGTGAATGAAHLAPGNGSTPGTLALGNGLTIGTGTNLDFDLGTTSSLITVTGNLSLGTNVVLNPTSISGFALNTQYDLINYTGTLSGTTGTWTASSLPAGATSATFAEITVSGTKEITVTFNGVAGGTPATAYWQGGVDTNWNTISGTLTNFTTDAAGTINTSALPGAATNVKFTANSAGNLNTVLGQDFTINSLEFTGTSTTAGTTSVTIGGTNTLTISASGTNGNTAGNGITVDPGSAAHTISTKVALGSSQTWTVNGSPLTVSGNVSDSGSNYALTKSGSGTLILSGSDSYTGATTVGAGTLEVDGSLSGSSAVTVDAAGTLTGTGSVGATTLSGSGTMGSAGTLTVASLGVSGTGNALGSGTVNATAGTTVTGTTGNNASLKVNGTLNGGVNVGATGSGTATLGGSGTINGGITVSAGGVLAPGDATITSSGNSVAINNGGAAAFAIANSRTTTGSNTVTAGTDYDQVALTSAGANLTFSGTTNLTLNIASGAAATISAHAASSYTGISNSTPGVNTNTTLDNYFVFRLSGGTTTGKLTTLTLVDSSGDTLTGTILYGTGEGSRFADANIGDIVLAVNTNGSSTFDGSSSYSQEFAISYTGNYLTNSTTGGQDVVLTAIPEPGTWGMILGGFGMLIGFQRLRKRQTGV